MQDDTDNSTRTQQEERQELNRKAQAAWRTLCRQSCEFSDAEDIKAQVASYELSHPGIIPESFQTENEHGEPDAKEYRFRRRKGVELVYGKPDRFGTRHGNSAGRLRVLEGGLQHRVLPIRDIPELEKFADVTYAQFDPTFRAEIDAALDELMPERCAFDLEFSEKHGLHSHLVCKRDTSDFGRFIRNVPDGELITLFGYLGKRVRFTPDNAECLLIVRQALTQGLRPGTRLPGRFMSKGVSFAATRVAYSDICEVLGNPDKDVTNPTRMRERFNPARKERSHDRILIPAQKGRERLNPVFLENGLICPNSARMQVTRISARMQVSGTAA